MLRPELSLWCWDVRVVCSSRVVRQGSDAAEVGERWATSRSVSGRGAVQDCKAE